MPLTFMINITKVMKNFCLEFLYLKTIFSQLAPGNTDEQGRCLVGFAGQTHVLEEYQVR